MFFGHVVNIDVCLPRVWQRLSPRGADIEVNDPILTNRNSSSRDNSIIIIKVLIGIIVYDLDVELYINMCSSFLILVCSTNEYLHDLSLNRRKSDWFLSNK